MKFILSEGTEELVAALTTKLSGLLLSDKKVLWLVTGGSNIAVACHVMAALPSDKRTNLTISLTDERYGAPGHPDSNQTQLSNAGFDLRGATFIPYLSGLSLAETAQSVEVSLKEAFSKADAVVALFGMGPDGHIAGMLPESVAAKETGKWVVGYDGGQFQRVTLTVPALTHVQSAYLGSFGTERLAALITLQNGKIPLHQQPAQVLKQIPEAYVYNDQIGSE